MNMIDIAATISAPDLRAALRSELGLAPIFLAPAAVLLMLAGLSAGTILESRAINLDWITDFHVRKARESRERAEREAAARLVMKGVADQLRAAERAHQARINRHVCVTLGMLRAAAQRRELRMVFPSLFFGPDGLVERPSEFVLFEDRQQRTQ